MYKLIVDDREKKVIEFIKQDITSYNYLVELKIDRINTGDYSISINDYIICIIERKTWKDLSASIKDGRVNNIAKLLTVREAYPCCKIIYLMEGKSRFSPNKKIEGIVYKNLQAHLDHIMMRDDVHIIYSLNCRDTSARIFEFIKNFSTSKSPLLTKISAGPLTTGGTPQVNMALKKSFVKSEKEIMCDIWCCIPYITTKTAEIFMNNNITINEFLCGETQRVNHANIHKLKYASGQIIGTRAKKIIKMQKLDDPNNVKYYVNMLACLKGLSKKTAQIILNNCSMREIINGLGVDKIKNIKKSEKLKVGGKTAENIIKIFGKPN